MNFPQHGVWRILRRIALRNMLSPPSMQQKQR
jgi:hypothetical protein